MDSPDGARVLAEHAFESPAKRRVADYLAWLDTLDAIATTLIASISGHDIGTFDEQEVIMGTYIVKIRQQAIAAIRQRIAYEQGQAADAR